MLKKFQCKRAVCIVLFILFTLRIMANFTMENTVFAPIDEVDHIVQISCFDELNNTTIIQNSKRWVSTSILLTKTFFIWSIIIYILLTLFCFYQYYFRRFDVRKKIKRLISSCFHGSKYKSRNLPVAFMS